jgi:hypothetical protein
MDKWFIDGKEFPSEDVPDKYKEEPKRDKDIKYDHRYFIPKKIAFTKEGYEKLKKIYSNFEKYKEFMQCVLSPDEYDAWLYQNQYIKDTYFSDEENKK